jgi:hypothetical protein
MPTKAPLLEPQKKSSQKSHIPQNNNDQTVNKIKPNVAKQSLITQFIETKLNHNHATQQPAFNNDGMTMSHTSTNNDYNVPITPQKQCFIQVEIPNYNIGNDTFGDDIQTDKDEVFYFHNVSGIKSDDNWAQILQTLHEHNVTCFGLAETNTSFAHSAAKDYLKKL